MRGPHTWNMAQQDVLTSISQLRNNTPRSMRVGIFLAGLHSESPGWDEHMHVGKFVQKTWLGRPSNKVAMCVVTWHAHPALGVNRYGLELPTPNFSLPTPSCSVWGWLEMIFTREGRKPAMHTCGIRAGYQRAPKAEGCCLLDLRTMLALSMCLTNV